MGVNQVRATGQSQQKTAHIPEYVLKFWINLQVAFLRGKKKKPTTRCHHILLIYELSWLLSQPIRSRNYFFLRDHTPTLELLLLHLYLPSHSQCKFFQNNLSLFSPNSLHKRALAAPGWGTLMQIPAHGIHVLWLRRDKFTQTTTSCGGKRTARPLSQEENTSTLALTGYYFWTHYIEDDPHLLFTGLLWAVTENKGENVANYIKNEGYL